MSIVSGEPLCKLRGGVSNNSESQKQFDGSKKSNLNVILMFFLRSRLIKINEHVSVVFWEPFASCVDHFYNFTGVNH